MIERPARAGALGTLFCMAAAGFCAPAVASAASDLSAIDAKLTRCLDKDSSNMNMKGCTGDAHEAADKVLNRLYQTAVIALKHTKSDGDAGTDRETLRRLVASERAWITYRDAECELQGTSMLGGSGEGLVVGDCLLSMTKDRVKSLDVLLNPK